jgi:hypothetical protein
VTDSNHIIQRIEQLRAQLTQKGRDFFDEWERRSESVSQSGRTELDAMTDQVWLADQMRTLSKSDLDIVMKAMQLHSLQVWRASGGEEIIEEMIAEAYVDPVSADTLVAQAQQLQIFAGEPLSPNMDVQEAGEVLRRLLFDPDV